MWVGNVMGLTDGVEAGCSPFCREGIPGPLSEGERNVTGRGFVYSVIQVLLQ